MNKTLLYVENLKLYTVKGRDPKDRLEKEKSQVKNVYIMILVNLNM